MSMIVTPIHVKITANASMVSTVTSVNVQEDLLEPTAKKVRKGLFCYSEMFQLENDADELFFNFLSL